MQGGNQVGEYTFNGMGQRIKKVAGGTTKIFHYDSLGHIIAESNQAGQMLAEYVYLGDQLLTMIKPGEVAYYYHNDHLGTPQVLTSESQTITWKAAYTPFGEAVTSIATVENPFRFPGQYYDSETGLHYNYFRYYNPPIGRYLTPDPIGLEGDINLFAYVNNPIRFIDPYGLSYIYIEGYHVPTSGEFETLLENYGLENTPGWLKGILYTIYADPGAPVGGFSVRAPCEILRSPSQKAKFLKQLVEGGKYPSWMNQWLKEGKVPPGFQVDHIKPLSIGGKDVPSNMRLQLQDLHTIHHKYYRPWRTR